MKIIKTLTLSLFFAIGLFSFTGATDQNQVNVYLFWGDGCPHCAKEKAFFDKELKNYPNVILTDFEVYNSQSNAELMQSITEELNIENRGVPLLIIGDEPIVGFAEGTTEEKIISKIKECSKSECLNETGKAVDNFRKNLDSKNDKTENDSKSTVFSPLALMSIAVGAIMIAVGCITIYRLRPKNKRTK